MGVGVAHGTTPCIVMVVLVVLPPLPRWLRNDSNLTLTVGWGYHRAPRVRPALIARTACTARWSMRSHPRRFLRVVEVVVVVVVGIVKVTRRSHRAPTVPRRRNLLTPQCSNVSASCGLNKCPKNNRSSSRTHCTWTLATTTTMMTTADSPPLVVTPPRLLVAPGAPSNVSKTSSAKGTARFPLDNFTTPRVPPRP